MLEEKNLLLIYVFDIIYFIDKGALKVESSIFLKTKKNLSCRYFKKKK